MRIPLKKCASLIVKEGIQPQRVPCLIVDGSETGYKIAGTFNLKKGQTVELIVDDYSSTTVPCKVMWVGSPGSKQGGEVGLRIRTAAK